ncbi:MAG TPA: hypothetical protein VFE05_10835 [Longimicrobiaceae bacterium]|nr:hypothetical protein [Longimicrobiaceae bacterium]
MARWRWWAACAAVALMPGAVAAQERWTYPRGAGRANPLAPPAELYSAEVAPPLVVTSVMGAAGGPLHAVARFGAPLRERRVVRAGDRVGPYRVDRVQMDGLWVRLYVLGTPRRLFVPRAGMRRTDAVIAEGSR